MTILDTYKTIESLELYRNGLQRQLINLNTSQRVNLSLSISGIDDIIKELKG